mgnify:CR=1 FL=1
MGFLGLLTSPALAMGNRGWAQIGKNPKTPQWRLWVKLYEYETMQVNDDSFEVRIRDDNGQDFPIKLNCRNKDLGIKKMPLTSTPQYLRQLQGCTHESCYACKKFFFTSFVELSVRGFVQSEGGIKRTFPSPPLRSASSIASYSSSNVKVLSTGV